MPYPLPLTRTEAYLAYKAGVIQQSDLKPSLAIPRNGIDAWLAYWTGLAADYPKREDGTPHILQEEEAYIAYLSGVINEYPEKCLRRVGAYLRYLISARWGRPDHPLNREELYLSLIKTQFIPSGDPSSDIVIDGTAKAPFVDVKMYGDTFQQTYTGKNLANPTPVSGGSNGVFATYNSQTGEVTVSGTAQTTWSNLFKVVDASYLTAGTYTLKQYGELTNGRLTCYARGSGHQVNASTLQTTFTTTSDGNAYICITGLTSGSPVSGTIKFQLESGSTATEFEPFVNGQPSPSPEYPQQIQTVTGEQTVTVVGKNLFRAKDGQYKDNTLTVNVTNGVIHVYGHQHAAYDQNIWIPVEDIRADGTYTLTMNYSGSGSGAFRLTKDKSYQAANNFGGTYYAPNRTTPVTASATNITYNWVLIYLSHGSSQSEVDYYINPQFESGSLSTYFSPYSKQTYTINLGKNLFDGTIYKTGYVLGSNGEEIPFINAVITSSIKVQPNTTYTVSANIQSMYDKYMRVGIYQGDMTFISRPSSSAQDGKLTFTTPANAQYVRLSYFVPATDVQIEVGSTASDFAPYFTPIELCKLGVYQDYIYEDEGEWKIRSRIVKTKLVSTLAGWSISSFDTQKRLYIPSQNAYGAQVVYSASNDDPAPQVCSHFTNISATDLLAGETGIAISSSGYLSIRDNNQATAQGFKDWLDENEPVAYAVKATPTDILITNSALIEQLNALKAGGSYNEKTYIKITATNPNLPGLLYVEAPKYE